MRRAYVEQRHNSLRYGYFTGGASILAFWAATGIFGLNSLVTMVLVTPATLWVFSRHDRMVSADSHRPPWENNP